MNKKSITIDTPEQSVGFTLFKTANEWQNLLKKQLASLDITPMELALLASLYWLITHKGEATQEHIAKHAKVGKMTVSKSLRSLEKKHWIHRKEHEIDTRAKSISINNTGMHVLKKGMMVIEKVDETFFAPLKQKANTLCELLHQLA